jgi:UDP-2,4-diacetamido-2,4,6-trideoxy-beta-L-altropyranose hydrolase
MADAGQIELRQATLDDMKQIFSWRNDPFLVARSSSRRMVEWTEHEVWFAKAITSEDLLIFVVEIEDDPIGQLRLERSADDCVISVYLLERYIGRGYGVQAIREGCARARQAWTAGRVVACVREDNPPGARAFIKAGFHACDDDVPCPARHRCFVYDEWGCA